ncbi:MAG: CoB--CoM heterodisulfide reductase iron-sulfur subunit B family protein [Dehalococcoidia bacterium]|nr:CoB--CoM heterodisulfide reductase iron-sulfur subunit B family protein [Dehalococcoidia bacterium]
MISEAAYYPGCALEGSAREYDVSTRLVFNALGVELREIPDWICCGASSTHGLSQEVVLALPAHALRAASQMDLPLMAPCAMCYSRFKLALLDLANADTMARTEAAIGEGIGPLPQVVHPLQVLEDISPQATTSIDIKAACYYGCLLVRPPAAGFDEQENPTVMDRIAAAWGAQPVPWAFKTECCGAGMAVARSDMVAQLSRRVLDQARQAGAEAVIVACPMCQANLDLYTGEKEIPVIYITQLIGLALGLSPRELLMDRHIISPLPLLRSKGVAVHG